MCLHCVPRPTCHPAVIELHGIAPHGTLLHQHRRLLAMAPTVASALGFVMQLISLGAVSGACKVSFWVLAVNAPRSVDIRTMTCV